jgi:Flp pilus assembly pilin Flp
MNILTRLSILMRARERGQTMAEYAVVLGVITLALIATFTLVGNNVSSALSAIASRV